MPIVALLLLLASPLQTAQPAALRVVVIEGEDAVNIIQQKTAVRPVVEVRDRNNLPVPGAVVTFSIQGGASTFGGASTLTLATNAAGQAAVTGLTPSAAGAFQIQVSAAFQGQVATATIAQTNVMTAAQAAAATAGANGASGASGASGGSGAGGAGGAAGGAGGGMSATTIAIAGAAVAGGAVAATQIVDKVAGEEVYTGTFSGTITGTQVNTFNTCTYTRAVTANAKLKFDEHTDSTVRGKFDYEGTESLGATTCPAFTQTPPRFIGEVDLTGSPASFGGRKVFPGPGTVVNGATITGEHVYTFQGSISGNTATGTFVYEESSLSTGGGGSDVRTMGTGTFTITFTKQ